MSAKYMRGQKVKIVSTGKSGRPEIRQYIAMTGMVLNSFKYSMRNVNTPTPYAKPGIYNYYYYTIRLDKDNSEVKVIPEDALEAVK